MQRKWDVIYLNHDQGYQFWTKTDADGSFSIENARIGDYNLYAWVPGFIGDYRYDVIVSISAGLGSLSPNEAHNSRTELIFSKHL